MAIGLFEVEFLENVTTDKNKLRSKNMQITGYKELLLSPYQKIKLWLASTRILKCFC